MRKWYQSPTGIIAGMYMDGSGSQWYEDDRPVCPVCDKRINEDELYFIGDGPVYHYYCKH